VGNSTPVTCAPTPHVEVTVAAVAVALVVAGTGEMVAAQVPRTTKPPPPVLATMGAALQARGINACGTPDWPTFSHTQDSRPFRDERARRARIVVVAPQACPTVDPHTGDVYGADANRVSVIGAFVFKSASALKRHAKNYTNDDEAFSELRRGAKHALFRGIGYVLNGNTLITMNDLPPPGMEPAFTAAMKDLGARQRYVSTLWRDTHPNT
jgi:hypothetical protein